MRLSKFAKGLTNTVSRHLPEILTGAAVVTGGLAVIFSAKGALEANKRLAEYEAKTGNTELSTTEKIKVAGPCYVPSGVMYAASIGCIIGARKIGAAQVVAALSSAAAAEKALRENRDAIKELFNKKGLQKVDTFIQESKVPGLLESGTHIYETGHGTTLCCESFLTGLKFHASPEWIYKCVNEFNDLVNHGEDPCFNDFLQNLLPLITERELPNIGETLRMPQDPVTGRPTLMEIQLDSALTDTGEPFLMFTQRNVPITRNGSWF